MFEGRSSNPPSTNTSEYVLMYDDVAAKFRLKKLKGMIKMSKSRNPEKLQRQLQELGKAEREPKQAALSVLNTAGVSSGSDFEFEIEGSPEVEATVGAIVEGGTVEAIVEGGTVEKPIVEKPIVKKPTVEKLPARKPSKMEKLPVEKPFKVELPQQASHEMQKLRPKSMAELASLAPQISDAEEEFGEELAREIENVDFDDEDVSEED